MQIGILPPELRSIEQLFAGDSRFSVPKYQRNFAWGPDEIEELWEDLLAAMQRQGEYFLGTLVLQRNDGETHEIIDGQQRLACIAMIFSAIRNVYLASRDNRASQLELAFLGSKDFAREAILTPKLVLNKINNETFVQNVLTSRDLKDIEDLLRRKTLHQSNRVLLIAYKYFLGVVTTEAANRGTRADEFLVPLINTLRSQLKLITIPVTSDEDANLFFESLNARGRELAISDLVKNRLYFEAGDQVDRAEQLWDQMESDLGRRPIPEFIRHYWIAKKAPSSSPMVREKHLYRMIAQAISGDKVAALALIQDIRESATDYAKISDFALWPDDPAYDESFSDAIADLRLFRVTQTNPLLLNTIQCFDPPSEVAKTFRIVANFCYRYFIIGNQSPGNLEKVSADIARQIRDGTYTSASGIADALRAVNPDPTFRSDFTLATFTRARARIARYTLSKISDHLAHASGQAGAELVANTNPRQVTLEHVLPRDLRAPWPKAFSTGIDPADFVHRIGNLTLLTAKVNREAADMSFSDKKRIALMPSQLPLNLDFKALDKWGEKEIEERQDRLAKRAIEVWRL